MIFDLTMSEYVDCFVVQIKQGFDTANPIGLRPVVTQDILVKSQVTRDLIYLEQLPVAVLFRALIFTAASDPFFSLMIMLHCVFHQHDCDSTVRSVCSTRRKTMPREETRDDPQIL